jgi:hypothetical protein
MTYSMFKLDGGRSPTGVGDSGNMSMALWIEDGVGKTEQNARPRVGVSMRVGSVYARTMQHQDWWQTTPITEIVEDTPERVLFRTRSGSLYEWRAS